MTYDDLKAYISLKRIKKFLLLDEINEHDIEREYIPNVAVLLQNVNLGWNKHEPYLYG